MVRYAGVSGRYKRSNWGDRNMTYKLEYSQEGESWHTVTEGAYTSIASVPKSTRPVERDRLPDIYREAEFHSHRYPHVRVVFP